MRKSFFSTARAFVVGAVLAVSGISVQAAPDPTGPASPENIKHLNQLLTKVRPDKMVMLGDMLVPATRIQAFRDKMVARASGKAYRAPRLAFDTHVQYWTATHIVPYTYDNLPASEQAAFEEAAREWEKYINIKFVPRTNEAAYVRIFQDPTAIGYAYATLGMTGGEQVMSLCAGATKFLTAHEIGHTLGLDHEHQRSDRDKYITVHYENCVGNEGSYTLITDTDNHGEYDFESIMHYFDTAFSTNGKRTMECKPGYESHQSTMGYQQEITITDRAGAADIYGFPPGVTATPVPTPTKPPRPTLVCDPITVAEGAAGQTTPMTFRVGLSYAPTKDVSFSYKVVRYTLPGESEAAAQLDAYSATPGNDYVEISDGTITLPAATTDNNGNSTREAQITLSIIGDGKVENDESLMLVLSDPVNTRFPNDEEAISIKGTISNDDFATSATPVPTNTPKPVATPVPTSTPKPVVTPRPTATPKPIVPTAKVTLTPTKPLRTSTLVAKVTLTPSAGTSAALVWRVKGSIVARNVTTLNLSRFGTLKRGDIVSVEVTPARGSVKGKVVKAQITIDNTPPVAKDATASTLSAVPVSVTLSGSDADGDALTYSVVTRPLNGTASITSSGGKFTLTYRSKVGFIGTESIGVAALDGRTKSLPATIAVQVKANTKPELVTLTPASGTLATSTTVTFTQSVKDAESNVASVSFLVGRSSSGAEGVGLIYDAASRTVGLLSDDGKELSQPFKVGATLENENAKVILRSVSTSGGTTTLKWQITFKPGFVGVKSLWAKVVDAGTLADGVRSLGKITISDGSTTTTKGTTNSSNSAGNS